MRTTLCSSFTRCITFAVALLAMGIMASPASAQNNCLQDEFGSKKLGCTADDVRVAKVVNVRALDGTPLNTCFQGSTFSFLADFEIATNASSGRTNVGLYFASQGQPSALTGTCVDNIISPLHQCPGASNGIMCGSDNYHATSSTDNCGETSSGDSSPVFGAAAEGVTVVINNFLCEAPAGSTTLELPNCTSWQIPGATLACDSPQPGFPWQPGAIPGTSSKCSCSVLPLPITPVTATAIVQKACTTTNTPGPATFAQNPNSQSPTMCDAGAEGSTVTYTVSVTNTATAGSIVIDQICDSQYGSIYTDGSLSACPAGSSNITATNGTCPPAPLAFGASGTCTFTAIVGENLTGLVDTVRVSGHSSVNTSSTFSQTSNSVTVTSSDAPSTATVTKGVAATEAACATVRYNVNVQNSSAADETLKLSAFNDTFYGDVTTVHGSVLGTTCGVASGSPGLGTLSGVTASSSNGGALPTTLSVGTAGTAGTFYMCQFDGQFCSALDSNSCISNVDKVTATLLGDEGEAVTQTGNTITVKECLAATVTQTTP